MNQHIVEILAARGKRVIDYEDAYISSSVPATTTADVAIVPNTRYPQAYIFAIGNFVETAGQSSVFWDLTVSDTPVTNSPYINFQVQISQPQLIIPCPFPIPAPQGVKIALRARNTGASAYQCTARIQVYYVEDKNPAQFEIANADGNVDAQGKVTQKKKEAQKFADIVG